MPSATGHGAVATVPARPGLSAATRLLLILAAAMGPFGLAMVWNAHHSLERSNAALSEQADASERLVARTVDSLVARNALALRVAASVALEGAADPCRTIERALDIAPGIARSVQVIDQAGTVRCGNAQAIGPLPVRAIPPRAIGMFVDPTGMAVVVAVGVEHGTALERIGADELRAAIKASGADVRDFHLSDGSRTLDLMDDDGATPGLRRHETPIASGRLKASIGVARAPITQADRAALLLPLAMLLAALLMAWWIVHVLVTKPLAQLEDAVRRYQPGDADIDLPGHGKAAAEIRSLGDAFSRTIARIDHSEREMANALDGQRRLVREVHHRVKNNLQVVASLLSIHSRTASTPDARAAYAGIMRRVDALSVVHRNHYAELEDNRGIALRPLLSELATGLRGGAPADARGFVIDLRLDHAATTQDTAVAVAFLVTEIVEYAMLNCPQDSVDVTLRRTDDLVAELALTTRCLIDDPAEQADNPERVMFERILDGLARQLRSPLDRRHGRYSVTIPVFPER